LLLVGLGTEPTSPNGHVAEAGIGAFVVGRDGTVEAAPLPGAFTVDMSANGRWVLLYRNDGVTSGGPQRYYRWDRATGGLSIYATTGMDVRIAMRIGDSGQVFEREYLTGNPYQGGSARLVVRDLTGNTIELLPDVFNGGWLVSGDGSVFVHQPVGGPTAALDTATGAPLAPPFVLANGALAAAIGSSGRVIVGAPSTQGPPTTADLVVATVPGRSAPPRVVAGETVVVPVAGVRGVPVAATSAVLNVTVTNPAGPGFATVWPCDEPRPLASNVNFGSAGTTVANAVVAKIASAGASAGSVCLAPSTAIDVIVDVQGYFSGDAYTGIAPDRFLDTRNGETDLVPNKAAGEEFAVGVAGVRGVPEDATSTVLNVTVTNSAGPGFVTVWPCDELRPLASNVNVTGPGQTVANAVVAKIATTGPSVGSVCVSGSTAVDVIVDVQGYFTGDAYSGIVPDRVLDTRNGDTDAVPNVAGGVEVPLTIAGVRGVPADAGAVVVNVTVTNPAGPGFVTVWPCDEPRPVASNVNFSAAGVTVANAVVAKVATAGPSVGAICLYASTGVDLIVDVQGSFTGAAYTGVIPDRFLDTRD
jgi:hypothetical protein